MTHRFTTAMCREILIPGEHIAPLGVEIVTQGVIAAAEDVIDILSTKAFNADIEDGSFVLGELELVYKKS